MWIKRFLGIITLMLAWFINWRVPLALGFSAASALIYEVVATDFLFFYFVESSYSIATVLSIFLLGLGLGSLLIYRVQGKIRNRGALFGIFQIAVAVYVFLVIANLAALVPRISTLGLWAVSLLVLFLPTVFLGAVFPLAAAILKREDRDTVGLVYFADILGAVLGALLAGFVLVPLFGNRAAVMTAAVLNLISAALILPKFKRLIPLTLMLFAVPGMAFSFSTSRNSSRFQFYSASPFGEVVVYNDTLYINGWEQCSLNYPENTSEKEMVRYALDPLGGRDLKVLNIGLGCGLTLQKIMERVEGEVDVVEINRFVVEANKLFTNSLNNKKVNLIIDDGLRFLRKTDEKYDSILVDVEDPTAAHSSDLYTVEAFELAHKALLPGGTFALWSYATADEYLGILYYSLKEYFPYVYRFKGVFLASNEKLKLEEYVPTTPYEINTMDRKVLVQAYLNSGFSVNALPVSD